MLQITLITDRDAAQAISEQLEQAGALALSLTDASDDPIFEPGVGETPLWARTRLLAWFDSTAAAHAALSTVEELLGTTRACDVSIEPVADVDWAKANQRESQTLCFGRKLWVVPPERAAEYGEKAHVLLTPGLAFGTGTHPTTALCLEWLCGQDLTGKTLLDYGCGSGFLAIAALKLGAAEAIGVDHDPQAITATLDNAKRNAVDSRLQAMFPQECLGPGVDIVVANIILNPLLELAPRLAGMVNPHARVVLSGVMKDQVQTLSDVYAAWFELEAPSFQDNWACVVGRVAGDSR